MSPQMQRNYMTHTGTLYALLVAALCMSTVAVRPVQDLKAARRSVLAGQRIPVGWWHTLKTKSGGWCGLRDFPPRTNGYGTSRLYCPWTSYDMNWMWRIVKVNASASAAISSGDMVYLTTLNPVGAKFCMLGSNVVCGVRDTQATIFTIEKANGTGVIDLVGDDVVLKVNAGYCSLTGRGHSQELKCAPTNNKTMATVFQFPASTFVHINLVNKLSKLPCGGYFYQDWNTPQGVLCGAPTRSNWLTTNLSVALEAPGAPVLAAGSGVAFKAYDDLYTYMVLTWKNRNSTVSFLSESTTGNNQWFALERLSGAATGGQLANSTDVALKSKISGNYCGIRSVDPGAMSCDMAGSLASLPDGYKYTYVVVPA